jgi:hypothetical protein
MRDQGKVGGAAKEGAFSEHGEVTGNRSKVSGIYVERSIVVTRFSTRTKTA